MRHTPSLALLTLLMAASAGGCSSPESAEPAAPPRVVVDTLGRDAAEAVLRRAVDDKRFDPPRFVSAIRFDEGRITIRARYTQGGPEWEFEAERGAAGWRATREEDGGRRIDLLGFRSYTIDGGERVAASFNSTTGKGQLVARFGASEEDAFFDALDALSSLGVRGKIVTDDD